MVCSTAARSQPPKHAALPAPQPLSAGQAGPPLTYLVLSKERHGTEQENATGVSKCCKD